MPNLLMRVPSSISIKAATLNGQLIKSTKGALQLRLRNILQVILESQVNCQHFTFFLHDKIK